MGLNFGGSIAVPNCAILNFGGFLDPFDGLIEEMLTFISRILLYIFTNFPK